MSETKKDGNGVLNNGPHTPYPHTTTNVQNKGKGYDETTFFFGKLHIK